MTKKFINVYDSTSFEVGVDQFVKVPIENNYAGDYRIEYDGKYITLFGKDKDYKGFKFNEDDEDWYEEMVLIPLVAECRNAIPKIIDINLKEKFILIQLNIQNL